MHGGGAARAMVILALVPSASRNAARAENALRRGSRSIDGARRYGTFSAMLLNLPVHR